ncbi:aminotransferase class I/II-fold pyridoxal phosphate-dependent enzyme [Phenylobacterium sp.]|uniref:aminotransferase class I/II-fold pyridoxal phosphate-dependent enzyme n=1 Tax=Phenylobacterium sp. TaxID=1871053 RepID=UPI002730C8A0|nr:aminotransferase class I/II-fold pyridoxal phosphate-dependent enzyme [Phenylobacterium sp.]MDP1619246.1 aminotransferase class I/II-fold pyridoxal phosphate-dependent enzyme [Phenylobacterium sp.]MDP1985760.1 aminotransferase class I/II-fold pyridoxal phosphate-dependent enzyme [Phenylobacterium sp.]
MTARIDHGGRLSKARGDHPLAPEPWLDLSTGINPQAGRWRRAPVRALARLPDPSDLKALEAAAARAFGAPADRVVAVPGAEAGLRLLAGRLGVRRVAIASPTYGSHADAWRLAGAEVAEVARDKLFETDAELRIIVNPNNPDGAVTRGGDLVAMAGDGWLLIDESFVEVEPSASASPFAGDRTIMLRSFGKFYGLPGVRLGFIVAPLELSNALRAWIGDWPVSADAIAMGQAAYADAAWAERTRARLVADAGRLDQLLTAAGLDVVGGTSLFRLARCEAAARRAWRLGEEGVLVRIFAHDPNLIRFGLPARRDWRRLQLALERSR